MATKRILFMMCSSQDSAIHAGSNEKQKYLLSNLTGGEPPAKEEALGIMDHLARVLSLKWLKQKICGVADARPLFQIFHIAFRT